MKTKSKVLESKTRIHYHDCDPFNHLNNSRYIDYIMAARTEQLLTAYDFDIAKMANEDGIGWVTAQTQISYLAPVSWMEVVTIETKLIHFSESSVSVEGFLWDEQKTKLKSILWTKLVHFDIKTQKSLKHSEALMELFGEIHVPLEQATSFEERVKSILKQYRG